MDKIKRLILNRFQDNGTVTFGQLETVCGTIICATLEPPWLDNEPFKSCIPAGVYKVSKYSSEKYPDVWQIHDVEGRKDILIHVGNWAKNTTGCVLVGKTHVLGQNMITNSADTMEYLRHVLPYTFELEVLPV